MKIYKYAMVMVVLLALFSCKKDNDCYDATLEAEFKNKGCTADCPDVSGCDGKTYCNKCEANKRGIKVD